MHEMTMPGIILVIIATTVIYTEGRVNIVLDYSPPYMQSGKNMSLVCNSRERYELEWSNLTVRGSEEFTAIVPTTGGPYITRKLYEEPTGFVENTLIIKNISLKDTGSYMCSDKDKISMFAIYVTVLEVKKTDLQVTPGAVSAELQCKVVGFTINIPEMSYYTPIQKTDVRVAVGATSAELECNVVGFTTNIPEMTYYWLYGGLKIPESSHPKYSTSQSDDWKTTKLVIKDIGGQDTGHYTCVFLLSVSFGKPFNLSESVHLDAGALPISSGMSEHPHWLYSTTLAVCLTLLTAILQQT